MKIFQLLLSFFYVTTLLVSACSDNDNVKIDIPQEYRNLVFDAGESRQTIQVTSNGDWTVKIPGDTPWCTSSHSVATGEQYINIYVTTNNTGALRNTEVIISGKGTEEIVIDVTQNKIELPVYPEAIAPDASDMNPEMSAMELSKKLKVGFNIGNTYEAIAKDETGNLYGDETLWGNPTPNAALFRNIKAAGFNLVRMPLAFSHQLIDPKGYEIKKEWLDKIAASVDAAIAAGLYININLHWDGGWIYHINEAHKEAIFERYEAYWKQIALRFRDYNDHLLFAGMNEIADEDNGDVWNLPPSDENQHIVNQLNQMFINIIRATGGRNYYRHLILQPYLNNIEFALSAYDYPVDVVENRTFVECHFYSPYQFCLATEGYTTEWGKPFADTGGIVPADGNEEEIDETLKGLKKFTDKNIPVLIGEWGAISVREGLEGKTLERHLDSRNYYTWYVMKTCMKYNLLPVSWDTGYMFDRETGEPQDVMNIDAIMAALAGEEYVCTSLQ